MNEKLVRALKEIDFVNRFQKITNEHAKEDIDAYFTNPDIKIVISIMESFDYNVKCYEKGKYYKITEHQKNKFDTYLKPISIEIGAVNIQFYATIDNELEGGQFWVLCKRLGNEIVGNLPGFSDYDELKVLLQKHFEIYEDLKKALLKENS